MTKVVGFDSAERESTSYDGPSAATQHGGWCCQDPEVIQRIPVQNFYTKTVQCKTRLSNDGRAETGRGGHSWTGCQIFFQHQPAKDPLLRHDHQHFLIYLFIYPLLDVATNIITNYH